MTAQHGRNRGADAETFGDRHVFDRSDFTAVHDLQAHIRPANISEKNPIALVSLAAAHPFAAEEAGNRRVVAIRFEYHRADAFGIRLCVAKST